MLPDFEKPKVTEIQVRMDCNGCVQKIKKSLYGINGIYDAYIDFPNQKLTIIGWADPEKIFKAIKKARKNATICGHSEPTEPASQPTEQAPEGGPPAPCEANPPPPEAPQAEAAPPAEPPTDPPPENPPPQENPPPPQENPPPPPENPPPPPENPLPEAIPSPTHVACQPAHSYGPKDVGEIHVIHHQPPNYSYRYGYSHSYGGHWNKYSNSPGFPHEPPQPIYVNHSYNTYKPSPYVTEYEHIRSPPRHTQYGRMDYYNEGHHNSSSSSSSSSSSHGNITSIFSDENPNACRIV